MAKANGLMNSGAAFEFIPTYNIRRHCLHRKICMDTICVRTMPERFSFYTWNWNAPAWLGVNTINVDGRTTTLCGSMFCGLEVV